MLICAIEILNIIIIIIIIICCVNVLRFFAYASNIEGNRFYIRV